MRQGVRGAGHAGGAKRPAGLTRASWLALAALACAALPAAQPPSASAAAWLPPVNVSPAVSSVDQFDVISAQDVAVDGQGNAIATWIQADVWEREVIRAATRAPGGPWSGAVTIADDEEEKFGLKVRANAAGDAAIAWFGSMSGSHVVRVATRPAGGAWEEPVALTDLEGNARNPDLAVAADGEVTVVWTERESSSVWTIRAAVRPAGGEWAEPVALSDSEGKADSPHLAVASDGSLTVVWIQVTGKGDEGIVLSKSRPPGGAWEADPDELSGPEGLATVPRVAVDAQGDATAVWQRKDIPGASGFRYWVQSARRVDGEWGETVFIATRPGGLEPSEGDTQVAVDPAGNATVVWSGWSAPNLVVRSARLPQGGAWSASVNVSPPGSYSLWPRLAVDPQGHATVVWSGYQAGKHAVRSAVFDPVPPEMGEIDLPATGVVGEPVAMSVEPFDAWSPVSTSWAFGDGGSAEGAAVEHCYSEPGKYTVTATGTDAAANSADVSATIEIEPDPDAEPGADRCNPAPPPPPPPPQPSGNDPPSPGTEGGDSRHNNLRPRRGCVVPRLAGMRLPRARRALRAAGCRLGRVRKARAHRARRLVVRSSPVRDLVTSRRLRELSFAPAEGTPNHRINLRRASAAWSAAR